MRRFGRLATRTYQALGTAGGGMGGRASGLGLRTPAPPSHFYYRGQQQLQRRRIITVIQQAEVAYREFLGQNRLRLSPGLYWNLPLIHTLWRVDMRETGVDIYDIVGFTKDNVPIMVAGTLFIQVEDPEKACFSVANFREAVTAIGQSAVRSIIGRFDYDTLTSERNQINVELTSVIGKTIAAWGVSCTRFEIQNMAPANRSVTDQLEAQMRAERARRENELTVRANINTAEGEKQARVLRSEGELQAIKNAADGEKYTVQAKTEALVVQIESLRKSLPGVSEAAVLDFLLESQRLENLRDVANGNNKQVYFLDPRMEGMNGSVKKTKVMADVLAAASSSSST